ncbi:MAG: purine-binding chemotaxis protein CheW [Acidobacteria bacterium]|nr:purine-binding chemotaxis protein CheW [Acidobacteriota bacterium]
MAETLHLVTFRIGNELFGVPISMVQEIVRVPAIARIPQAPEFIEGVINLRGRVITVVDMHKRLNQAPGNPPGVWDRKSRILVIETGGRLVGIIVDEVKEVLKLAADKIEAPPPMVAGLSNQYIKGVGKLEHELLILIEIEKVLTVTQLSALDAITPLAA